MRVCPLQCRLSLTLSVVIAVRQTVIILGRAPLGGKTRGGRRIMDALVFALSCFSSCLCRHPFLLTTLRSLVKTPLYLHWMTQPHYLRLSPFPSLSFSKLDLKKKKNSNATARKFDGSTTVLTSRGLRQATKQRAAVSTHSLLLHCLFCLQILVIDARGPNY